MKDAENCYTCQECGAVITTIDRDEGVNPFMVSHKTFGSPTCPGACYSSFYPKGPRPSTVPDPTYEWVKLSPREIKGKPKHHRDYYERGGLDLRKIAGLIIAACCLSLAAQAQDKPTPPMPIWNPSPKSPGEAPKAPVIPDAQKAEFQKARADFDEAQMQADKATTAAQTFRDALNVQIKAMQETCGPLWQAQLDKNKNPFCAAKPPEAAKK